MNQQVQEGAMELKGSPAHTPKKAKTRCEITITLAKEEDCGGSGPGAPGTAADASAGLAAKAVPCSTTQPGQAKPAGPVHHLSASVESQICCQHGADPPAPTAPARPVTGPPVTQRQCWEPIPGSSSEQTAPSRCRSPGPEESRRSAFEDSEVSEEGLLRSEQYEMEAAPERSGAHQTISRGFALRGSSLDLPVKNKRKYIYKVSLVRTDMLSSTSSGDSLPGADNTPGNDSPVNALSREDDVPTDKSRKQEKGEPSDGISKGTSLRQLPRSTSLRDFKKTSYPDLPNIVVHSAVHAQVYSPTKKRWRHVEFGRVSGSDSSEDKSPKEETIHNGGNYTGSSSDRDSPSARECTETDAPNTGVQQNIDSSIIKMQSKEITSQKARGSTRNASPTVNGSPPRNGLQDECCTETTKYSSEEHGQTKSALSASRLPKQRHSQIESCMTETGGSLQERRWQKGLNNIASVQQSVNSHQRDNIGSLKKSPQHTSWQKQDATLITESPPKDQRNITSPSAGNRSPPEHTWHNKSTSPGAKFPPRASWQNTPLSIMGTSPPRSHRLTKSSITKATSSGGAWHNKPSSIMARSPPSHQFLNKYGGTIANSPGSSWKNKPNGIKTTPSSQVSIPDNKFSRTMTTAPLEIPRHNESDSRFDFSPPGSSGQNTSNSMMVPSPPGSPLLNKPSALRVHSPLDSQDGIKHSGIYSSTATTSPASSWKNKPSNINTTPSSQVSITHNKSSRTMTTEPLEIPRRNEPDSRFDFSPPGSPGHSTSNSMMVPSPPRSPLLNKPSPPRVHSPLDSQDGIKHIGKYSSKTATTPGSSWKNKPSSIKTTPSSQVSIPDNKSSRTMTTAPLEIPRHNELDSRFDFSPRTSPGHNTSNSMMVPSPPRSPLLNKPSPPRVHSPLDSQDGITHIGKYSSETATSPGSSWKNKPSSIKTTPSSQVSIPDNKSSRTVTTAPLEIPRRNEPDSRFDFSPPGSPGHSTSNSMMVPSPPRSPLLNKPSPPRVHSPLDSQDGITHIGKYSSETATSPGSSWKNKPSSIKTTPSSQVSIPDNKSSRTVTTAPLEIPRHNELDSRFDFSPRTSPGHNTSNSMMVPSPPRSPLLNKPSPPRVHSPLDSQDGITHIGKYSSETATSPGSSWKNKPSSIKTTPSSQVSIPDNKSSRTIITAPLEIPRHNELDSRFDFSPPGSPGHNTSNSMMVPSPPGSPLFNKHSPPRAYSPLDCQDGIAHTGIMSMSPPGSPVHNKPTSLYATSPPVIPRKKSLTSKVTELVRESPEQCDSSSLVIASPPESVLKDDFHSMDSQSSPQSPLNKTTRTMKTKSPSESNEQEAVGHIVITSVSSEDQNEMIGTMSEQIDKTNEDNETNETVSQLHQKTSNHIETRNRENTSFPKPSKHNEDNETVVELEPKSNNQYLTTRKITELPPEINSQDEENSAITEHLPEISNKNDTSRIVSETTLRNSQNSGSCSSTDSPEENNHQFECTEGVTEPLPKNTIEIVEHNVESSSIARSPSEEEDNEPTLASVKASDWSHATDPEINISAQANLDNNLEFLIPDITRDNEISGTCTTVVNADGPTQHTNSEAADILSGEIFRENDVPTVGVPTLGPNSQVHIISYEQTPMENLETTNMVDPFVGNTKKSKSEAEISSVESGTASSAVNPSPMAERPSECLEMEDDVNDITSDMESWVDILRRLETPEIMKYARVPRQPRTSPMSVYATLSPIEEDGALPKTPLPLLARCSARVDDEEIEFEDVKSSTDMDTSVKPIQENGDTSVKPIQENGDPTDVSEKPKHVFSWEKSISRGMDLEKSSPLEMMRRHVEEDSTQVTRTAGYRSLLEQNSSTRASSSVGSLLLSERLEKTSIPEHKPYSRLNSLLFNSYKGPDKALFGRLEKEGTPNNDTTMPQVTALSDSNGGIHNLLTDPAKQTSDSPKEAPAPSTAPELNVQPNILPPEASSAVATSFSSEKQDQLDDLLMNEGCPEETPTPSTASDPNSQPNILLTEPSSAVATSVSLENQGQPGGLPMNEAQQSKTWQSEDQQSVAQQETTEAQMSDTQEDELQNNMASEDEDTQSKAQQNKPGHSNVQPQPELHTSPGGLQEEEHERGKLNPRPGKMVIFTEPGLQGEQHEIWGDLYDATVLELPSAISIRVIRGGWVLYEKPRFQGQKIVLEEGDIELRNPWGEEVDDQEEGDEEAAKTPIQIGSLRHVVRDYAVPAISLFHEENGEGKKMKFMDASYDARMYGQPLKAASIIVHSGLWVVYQEPFFEGHPYILEPGGYPTLKSWGGEEPQICSLQPIQIGCPTVEKPYEPKILLFERAHFEGHSWEINKDICDLKREDDAGNSPLSTVGSLRVLGGCWVGYEKEGFHGHQYLLEEGEYRDWKDWGGQDDHLKSIRLIRADFSEPALVLYAEPNFAEGPCLELSDALPDVKLAQYWTTTQSILVHSGMWVAYENVDYSGAQYVLEKGTYHSCQDWGASTGKISSLLPILQVGDPRFHYESQIHLFSQPGFDGDHYIYEDEKGSLPEGFNPQSCRVHGGSWILYEDLEFSGNQYILSEGEYPTYTAMGCLSDTVLRSLMQVPIHFSQPAISLHGLENFEGKEIELTEEVRSLQAEGFNNHVLSVRVKGGIWVLYEHNDYRGRQWLLDYTEVKNWLEYSGIQRIGSLRPIRQRRIYFHIKNRMLQQFLCIKEEAVDMTAVRVLVSEPSEEAQLVWFYEDGCIKNQASPDVSLQVIGAAHKGCKAVLWSQTRMPCQTWRIDPNGHICSQMFEGMILDVKGGEAFDRDHVILWTATEERPTQMWTIEVL